MLQTGSFKHQLEFPRSEEDFEKNAQYPGYVGDFNQTPVIYYSLSSKYI